MNHRLLIVATLALAGCSAGDGAPETGNADLQGGAVDKADPAVGLIWFGDNICTGTVIAPTVVLTAGHCVQDAIEGFYTGTGKATSVLGSKTVRGLIKHEVASIAAHPSYERNACPNPTLDIGLVHLAAPLIGVAPVKLTSAGKPPAAGDTCTGIGFGLHTEAGVDTFAQKRSGTELVEGLLDTAIQVKSGTALADHGDSGGPLLCGGVIVGATSCHNDGSYPQHQEEYYARVEAASPWIAQKLEEWK